MPRMLDRLRDKFDFPDFVQRWRIERLVQAEERRRDPSWFFQTVPADRLNQFHADLTELVEAIRAEGGCPILLTHATAFRQPLDASEMNALRGLRVIRPRAPETVLIEFEEAARGATLAVARETGTDVVDVSAQMTGRREWFAPDFLHFNDDGAAEIGKLIAAQVAAQLRADAK
jgi:lysophospholipase L1-like esterase